MPNYDFSCLACDTEFEAFRLLNSQDPVICPKCKSSKTKKQISCCHFIIHSSAIVRKITDSRKREREAKADLAENYGVENLSPLGRGNSMEKVYKEIKKQGTFVKDKMQQQTILSAAKTRKKQREWAIGANQRVEAKTRARNEEKKKEAFEKRAIRGF